jgi:GTP cyclohydrolase FolE2
MEKATNDITVAQNADGSKKPPAKNKGAKMSRFFIHCFGLMSSKKAKGVLMRIQNSPLQRAHTAASSAYEALVKRSSVGARIGSTLMKSAPTLHAKIPSVSTLSPITTAPS